MPRGSSGPPRVSVESSLLAQSRTQLSLSLAGGEQAGRWWREIPLSEGTASSLGLKMQMKHDWCRVGPSRSLAP